MVWPCPIFDSFENVRTDILSRMDEPEDSTSDWFGDVARSIVRAFHDLHNRHAWWWATVRPPGVFNTVAQITARTITIATAGTSVTGTLDATVATSLTGFKIRVSGRNYIMRITAHTAGTASITLDSAPNTEAAGTATTIYQDEYQLASDLGIFTDGGIWSGDGNFIPLWSLKRLLSEFPDPPSAASPPSAIARIDKRYIRFSHYPTIRERYEYPYAQTAADPSGTGDLIIDQNWRWVLSDGGLYFAYLLKSDKRAAAAKQDYERAIQQLYDYDRRMRQGQDAAEVVGRRPYQ